MVEIDPTQGIELKEIHAQRVPQRRRRIIHRGESEHRETNPCVSSVVCLTTCALALYLYFRFDLLWCVVSVLQGLKIHLISPANTKFYLC